VDFHSAQPTLCTLRDANTGKALRQWTGRILDVLPDLSLMVTTDDLPINHPLDMGRTPAVGRLVEVASGRILGTFPVNDYPEARFSHDGHFLCLPGEDQPTRMPRRPGDVAHPARVLRVPGLTSVLPLPPLAALQVSHDGSTVVGSGWDSDLQFWTLPSLRHTVVPTGLSRARWIYSLPNAALVVAGETGIGQSQRSVIQVRSPDGTRLLRSFPSTLESYSADGRFMASVVSDQHGVTGWDVFDLESGKRVVRLNSGTDALSQPVSSAMFGDDRLAVSPDGHRFVSASRSGLLRFYNLSQPGVSVPPASVSVDSGRTVLSFSGSTPYEPSVLDAVTLPGGGVAASGGADTASDGRAVQVLRPGRDVLMVKAAAGRGTGSRLGISPDGGLLAESSQWGVWTLDLASGHTAAPSVSARTKDFRSAQAGCPVWLDGAGQPFSVVSVGVFGGGPVLLTRWNAAGQMVSTKTVVPGAEIIQGQEYQLGAAEASPDGNLLAVLWNGIQHKTEAGKTVDEMTAEGMMELRDTRTGRVVRTLLATHRNAYPAYSFSALGQPAFSPDGRLLAVADERGSALLFDVATGRKIGQMSGMRPVNTSTDVSFVSNGYGSPPRLAFSPDDRLLAAARNDGSLYLYSLRTFLPVAQIGRLNTQDLGTYGQVNLPVRWLAFDASGKTIYGIVQNNSDVLAWDVPKAP